MNASVWVWIAIGSLVVGAVLAAVQLALRSVTRTGLELIAIEPGKRDEGLPETLEKILGDIPGHAAAVAVPRVIANLIAGIAIVPLSFSLFDSSKPESLSVLSH